MSTKLGSNNPFPSVLIEEGTTPASPAAGHQRLFIDTADNELKRVNSSGSVTSIEGGGAGLSDGDYGDVTVSASGTAIAIDNDVVSDAKLRNSSALSVIGRSANSTGDPADIAAANDGEVLRRSGTSLGFGTVATAGIAADAVTYAKMQNVSAASKLVGRGSAGGSGDPEEITLGTGLSMTGTTLSSSGTGAMAAIDEATPSGTGTLTFASLGSYKYLEIRFSARSSKAAVNAEDLLIRFNGDTGGNYDTQILYNSSGTVAAAFEQLAGSSGIIAALPAATATANSASGGVIRIADYAGTTFNKIATCDFHAAAGTTSGALLTRLNGITWRNTSAITSITLLLGSGNFVAGSKFTLYGLS